MINMEWNKFACKMLFILEIVQIFILNWYIFVSALGQWNNRTHLNTFNSIAAIYLYMQKTLWSLDEQMQQTYAYTLHKHTPDFMTLHVSLHFKRPADVFFPPPYKLFDRCFCCCCFYWFIHMVKSIASFYDMQCQLAITYLY